MSARFLSGLLFVAGCTGPANGSAQVPQPQPTSVKTPTITTHAEIIGEVVFHGMCDASGAISLSSRLLIAADDEGNVLRLYDADAGGEARSFADVSEALGLPLKGKKKQRYPEVDLEAATLLGERAYWLSSHGRNKKGKLKEERLKFFATTVPADADADAIEVVGAYDYLLQDLAEDGRYAAFDLESAAELPPKAPGGLNIEGMTASTDGVLLIGFRNPIPDGGALIAPLQNPGELVDDPETATARFGDPILLDLGGQGIRSLSWWRGRYLIIAGEVDEGGVSRLFTWDGRGQPVPVDLDLAGYNPEGFFSPEDRDEILLLNDDGSLLIDDVECKEAEPEARRFRGVWVRPSS